MLSGSKGKGSLRAEHLVLAGLAPALPAATAGVLETTEVSLRTEQNERKLTKVLQGKSPVLSVGDPLAGWREGS